MGLKLVLKKCVPHAWHSRLRRFYYRLRSLCYRGRRFTCPCCGRRFRKFLTFGRDRRPNVQCPGCGSLERHRLLWLYLKNRTTLFTEKHKVLDVAPMQFFQDKCRKLPNLDYISADLSSPLAMLKLDIAHIPIMDNQFDCVFSYHVFEHVPDDQKAMREIFRVLKPGGWAILNVPIDFNRESTFEDPSVVSPQERRRVFGHEDHIRIYGRDYTERLKKADFIVTVDNYAEQLGDATLKECSLKKEGRIHFCLKPQ